MLAKCYSGAINGVDASAVEIEVYSVKSTSSFTIVGLPDAAVREAKDRVTTALKNSGWKSRDEFAVTVNLAPADVRKEGPIYDLPIAICLLKATQRLGTEALDRYGMVGELALSGEVRKVRGVLPIAMEMKRIGRKAILVPVENAREASIVSGIDVIPVATLADAARYLAGEIEIEPCRTDIGSMLATTPGSLDDLADVRGQETAKRAIEVAVAGGHNILMVGTPGSGKTMLARCVPSILPPLTVEEALEISKIHSVAGAAKGTGGLVATRPFRAPHHTVSSIGLLGGGAHPIPGEVSLAHRGVLFLDEFAEFPRQALEVMRQPLEDGHVCVSRASASCDYPSRFLLVAAMNPCPCGYYGDRRRECRCTQTQILKYQQRVSGPLLDRIDMQIGVSGVLASDLERAPAGESSAAVRERVVRARAIQAERYRRLPGVLVNADVRGRDIREACRLTDDAAKELHRRMEIFALSARAHDRILKVARTIADLAGKERVDEASVMEAASYRQLDDCGGRSFWA